MTININPKVLITGRLSDGSDKQIINVYEVIVTDNKRTYFKIFDHEPSEQEINIQDFQDITPKEDLIQEQIDLIKLAIDDLILNGGAL